MRGAAPLARDPGYCRSCLEKQQAIDRLTEEVRRLKSKLRRQERTAMEEPFGESTPSSRRLVKSSSTPEARSRIGGAKPGHQGYGRSSVCCADADEIVRLDALESCPQCGGQLSEWGERTRTRCMTASRYAARPGLCALPRRTVPVAARLSAAGPLMYFHARFAPTAWWRSPLSGIMSMA